jgi:FKBP-type peptidyl-prolyl cis-trans isomerase
MDDMSDGDQLEQQFLEVNKYLRDMHQDHIEAFVERVGWDMKVSSTGLWYYVDYRGDGKTVQPDSRVSYAFASLLLDGQHCYHANADEPMNIVMGKGGVEAGVEEGLLYMREGDSATFIIPPHLAHGNFGDRNKIPGNTVIIYKVTVLKVD